MSLRLSTKVDLFLKPDKVYRAEARATKGALNKAGAFVRRRARTQYLRRRKRVSKPGQGPSVHTKHPYATLKNIRFALDSKQRSVIVGPLKFTKVSKGKPVNNTVPGVLESGGGVVYARKKRSGKTISKIVRIAKRPFMAPAFKDELPKFSGLWKGKVK